MRQALVALAAAAILIPTAALADKGGFDPDALDVGEPVVAHNIAVVPLFTKKAPPYDEYVVLEESQKAKSVKVAETKAGDVDKLVVKNQDTDKRPLYLLGGEVVLGGKQDRMVVNDTVVDAASTKVLEVRCVEQGRWDGADLTFRSSESVAHPDLRKAALFKGQGDVWNEVARKSAASQVSSTTGTYRRVLQDKAVRERIKGYLDELQSKIPKSEKLTGLAVAINGNLGWSTSSTARACTPSWSASCWPPTCSRRSSASPARRPRRRPTRRKPGSWARPTSTPSSAAPATSTRAARPCRSRRPKLQSAHWAPAAASAPALRPPSRRRPRRARPRSSSTRARPYTAPTSAPRPPRTRSSAAARLLP
ncbi:MAG: hypothetical protein QM765_08015 [Myxococcales bacterium]